MSKNHYNSAMKTLSFDAFRKNLSELIYSRRIRQIDVAESIGCTRGTMSRYMTGDRDPDIEFVYRIANFFHVSIDWLLGLTAYKNSGFSPDAYKILDMYTRASDEDKLVINTVLQRYDK